MGCPSRVGPRAAACSSSRSNACVCCTDRLLGACALLAGPPQLLPPAAETLVTACALCHQASVHHASRQDRDMICATLAVEICHSLLRWTTSGSRSSCASCGPQSGSCLIQPPMLCCLANAHHQGARARADAPARAQHTSGPTGCRAGKDAGPAESAHRSHPARKAYVARRGKRR